ncbi:tRNA-splicing endonuclease subunit Sen34 [Mortierella alpina]|nr:tRNA-splicing endonuclease subunit Sen34 [Mortierella alpina]
MDAQERQHHQGTQGTAPQQKIVGTAQDLHRPRIHITGSEALVWNVQDVKRLRQDHRIVGSLAGCLPRSPMQNIFQGLPLRLQPEEVYALWSHGLVDLVDERRSYPPSSASASASVAATTTAVPVVETMDEKVQDVQGTKTSKSKGGPGGLGTKGSGADATVVHTRSDHLLRYSPRTVTSLEDISMGPSLLEGQAIFAASADMGRNNVSFGDGSTEQQQKQLEQQSPWQCHHGTKKWQQRMVFMHLWKSLQFYLAPGMKFGGDYLLYRNDPLVCHASFIASVKDKDEPLSLTDLASSARLASTVQKLHLLCSVVSSPPSPQAPPQARPVTDERPEQEDQGHHLPQVHGQGFDSTVVVFAVEWAGF